MTPLNAVIKPMDCIRGLVLEHNNRNYYLNAGTRDTVHIFTKSICIYVLTINIPLGYIGLDAYYPTEEDPVLTIFLHSDYQITDALGTRWQQMTPKTIATRLTEFLI
jgi:hypothetical protein